MKLIDKKDVELRVEEEDGFALLYDASTKRVFYLNPTGSWLWQELQPGIDVKTLLDKARQDYNLEVDMMTEVSEQVVDCIIDWWIDGLLSLEVKNRSLTERCELESMLSGGGKGDE